MRNSSCLPTILSAALCLYMLSGSALAAPLVGIKCPKGATAQCLVDPCSLITRGLDDCIIPKGAVCVANYCTKPTTYYGQPVPAGPCTYILVDTTTHRIVPCKPPPPCSRSKYTPVCGSNGKTYINKCFAKKAKVTYRDGPCVKPCNALCVRNKTCANSKSPCKGNPNLVCKLTTCTTQHVTAWGAVVWVPACSLTYFNKTTGFIKPSCTV